MRSASCWRLFTAFAAGLAFVLLPPTVLGADKDKDKKDEKKDRVKFTTYDEVELHGAFYPGSGGNRKSPTVMLLHELGGNSQQTGWSELATKLQDQGFSVLTFDFRGHGKSTSVGKTFWSYGPNRNLRANARSEIAFKDFPPSYFPYLVNDIMAAKRFLDEQNDGQLCNSANLILIGAKDGATLGCLWAASEFTHVRYRNNQFGRPVIPAGIEGEDLTCCIWLSISPTVPAHGAIKNVGGMNMPVSTWLVTQNALVRTEAMRDKVPMYFISNTAGARYNQELNRTMKVSKSKITKYDYFKELQEAKNLSGRELLGKSLDVEDYITKYVAKVTEDGDKGWKNKDSKNKPPLGPVMLNRPTLLPGY